MHNPNFGQTWIKRRIKILVFFVIVHLCSIFSISSLLTSLTFILIMVFALLPALSFNLINTKKIPLAFLNIKEFIVLMDFLCTKLKKQFKRTFDNTDFVFLGDGFLWQTKHAHLLYQFLNQQNIHNHGFEKTINAGHIHQLEKNNVDPIIFPSNFLTGHSIIFGTTGTGKTTFLILHIVQAILRHEPVIVIDPKGDHKMMEMMQKCMQLIQKENLFCCLDILDANSHTFNPLSSFEDTSEIGARIGDLLPSQGSAQSFKAYGQLAISACASLLLLQNKKITCYNLLLHVQDHNAFFEVLFIKLKKIVKELNNIDVTTYFNRLCGIKDKECTEEQSSNKKTKQTSKIPSIYNLKQFYSYLLSKQYIYHDVNIDNVLAIACMDKSFYQKVTAVVIPVLQSLCSKNLLKLISNEGISDSFLNIINKNKVLYVSLHCLQNAIVGGNLGKILLSDLCSCAGFIYHQRQQNKRINIFLDESSELVNESLVQLLNKSRGANFAITLATQTFADLVKRSGSNDSAMQILGNCNNLYSLRCTDAQSADYIAEHLIKTQKINKGSALTYVKEEGTIKTSVTQNLSISDCPIFSADAIKTLPNFEFICKLANGALYKGIMPFLTD